MAFDYIVGNRNFRTYEEAMKYCDLCDFDFHEMIEVKEIKDEKEIQKPEAKEGEIYWYEYKLRGFSLGCQPKGFVDRDESKGKWGIIAYDRKLSRSEMDDYDLREWRA